MADPGEVRAMLGRAGFTKVRLTGLEAPMHFGTDPDDALAFLLGLVGWMLEGLDEDGRVQATEALLAGLAARHTADGVQLGSAAWLVTARRAR